MSRTTLSKGDERRRRWSEEDRVRILAAFAEPGAVVAEAARHEDICTGLVYKWRRETRRTPNVGASGFSPVIIEAPPSNGSDLGVI